MNSPSVVAPLPPSPATAPVAAKAAAGSSLLTAGKKRAAQPLLLAMFALGVLLPRLPLVFPVAPALPPSAKLRYRSQYRCPGLDALLRKENWEEFSDFEIALYLIDFSPLERVLAQKYKPSPKGQVPFHPVSLFLCLCLRRELKCSWRKLAALLKGAHGATWRALFGFAEGKTPSASGLRYFFNTVGPAFFDELCPSFADLLREHGLFPERSTYPGDPPEQGVTISQDGMLHAARHRSGCLWAADSCYKPLADALAPETGAAATAASEDEAKAEPPAARPCRARQKGGPGCPCDTPACREQCQRASVLDPQARFIHYDGGNGKHSAAKGEANAAKKAKGKDVFGYRSTVDRVLDDRFAIAWNVQTNFYPANTDERSVFGQDLQALQQRFPDLKVGEWLDDAGVGYGECLKAIYQLGALRMVDIRADQGDEDPATCLRRGYNAKGLPLCAHGYPLRANGYDYERRRHKYVCGQVCRREPLREGEGVTPLEGCPYLDEAHPLGQVVNVGLTLPDGSSRLARDIPYDSPIWRARYGRRNLSESRNSQMEGIGLKRLPNYGSARNGKEVKVADFLLNLRTLARLVREARRLSQN